MPRSREREAKHGQKMIEVKIRFWTDSIAERDKAIVPKHAWAAGMMRITTNKSHGIDGGDPKPFNSLMEIPAVLERILVENGIKLHPYRRMEKYVVTE